MQQNSLSMKDFNLYARVGLKLLCIGPSAKKKGYR